MNFLAEIPLQGCVESGAWVIGRLFGVGGCVVAIGALVLIGALLLQAS